MFEWDEKKREINLSKHGIDFIDAKEIWQRHVLEIESPQAQHDEKRFLAIGEMSGICITVIYTWRDKTRRIISARRARDNEKEAYSHATR